MSDYRVNLEVFSGPLDLLLYLVRKEEVDIYDISIAKITEEYIRYIEILKMLNMELAGDFLIMAATLMEIKSAMLLPADELEDIDQGEAIDPRKELIRQLLEYKKFKDAANMLKSSADIQKQRYQRNDTAGIPVYYTIEGDAIHLMPTPDASYTLQINYYKSLPAMSDSGDNWLLVSHPDIYLYSVLMQASPYLMDSESAQVWDGLLARAMQELQMSDEASKYAGGTLNMKTKYIYT